MPSPLTRIPAELLARAQALVASAEPRAGHDGRVLPVTSADLVRRAAEIGLDILEAAAARAERIA